MNFFQCSLIIFLFNLSFSGVSSGQQLPGAKTSPPTTAELKERSKLLLARQSDFHKGVQNGTVKPYADLRSEWAKLTNLVSAVKFLQTKIAKGDGDVDALSRQLYDLLQKIGPYLDEATVPDAIALKKRPMSAKQVSENRRIVDAIESMTLPKPDKRGGPRLKLVGPQTRFTVLFLSVPIQVQAPPESTVYFEADAGGHFQSNGLAVADLTADKSGTATAYWVSDGDAAGESVVTISSPQAVHRLSVPINVVDPRLRIPAGFNPPF